MAAQPSILLSKLRSPGPLATLVRGAGAAFLVQTTGTALGYFGQILLARWMGVSDYGAFTYALTWAQVLAVLAAFGLDAGVVRFIPEYLVQQDGERLRGILRWSRRMVLLTGFSLAGLGSLLTVILKPDGLEVRTIVVGLVLIPLLALSEIQTQTLRSAQQIALAYAPPLLLQPLALVGGTYFLAGTSTGLTSFSALCALALALLATLAVQGWAISRALSGHTRRYGPAYAIDQWLRVSFPLLLTSVFFMLLLRMDSLLVGVFLGLEEVGMYSAAAKTATVVSFTLAAVYAIVAPLIVSLHARRDIAGLQRVVRLATFGTFWPSVAIGAGLLLLNGSVLGAFGPEFVRARFALLILILGQLVNVGTGPVGLLLSLTGRERRAAAIFGWSAGLHFLLCTVAIPWLGITGAALATAIAVAGLNLWLDSVVVSELGVHASIVYATRATLFQRK